MSQSDQRTLASDEATLASGDSTPSLAEGRMLVRGDAIGRYVVLDRLGAGGMGVVYAAYDADLDRKVAVKLLRGGEPGTHATNARNRLLREAQAMAKLAHPNVVPVHDVGVLEGQVWVAMELVRGKTMRQWLDEASRSWREVVDVFCDAGRGLKAAHDAGLVHRDFKPDNVMIGDDGRVRVMDFGLARSSGEADDAPALDGSEGGLLSTPMTRAGALVGTPAYMAPEQYLGLEVGPRTDQFSYCVALWEALYGERPFAGKSIGELAIQIPKGEVREPPRGSGVPGWVNAVVRRGLGATRQERWPDMQSLVDGLNADPSRRRRRMVMAAAGVAVVGALLGGRELDERARIQACQAGGEAVAQVWNEDVKLAVGAALHGTGAPYAPRVVDEVSTRLDAYAAAWSEARVDTCLATEVDATRPVDLHERSVACLDDRRAELAAVVSVLGQADAVVVRQAVRSVMVLPDVASCLDDGEILRRPTMPRDSEARERIAVVRRHLSSALAATVTAHYDEGLASAQAALQEAEALGWDPVIAEAAWRIGDISERKGEYERAVENLERAYFVASKSGMDLLAARAASALVFTVGDRLSKPKTGLWWAQHAEMLLTRAGEGDRLPASELATSRGSVAEVEGDYETALKEYTKALEIRERVQGPEHPDVATALTNVGLGLDVNGRYPEALEHYARALALREKALGPKHPLVANTLDNMGVVLTAMGKYPEAREHHERALEIHRAAPGSDPSDLGIVLNNLGTVAEEEGDHAEAARKYGEARVLFEKAYGPDHPYVAATVQNVAMALDAGGDPAASIPLYREAIAIKEKTFGTLDHPSIADTLVNEGIAHRGLEQWDEALGCFRKALEIQERVLDPGHPRVALSLMNLAGAYMEMKRHGDAVDPFSRAVKIYDVVELAPETEGQARFGLARALWKSGGDRIRARELAEQALADYREAGEQAATRVKSVEDWLASPS